ASNSDAQGPAWPESPGLGLAWVGLGSGFCKPKPSPQTRLGQAGLGLGPGLLSYLGLCALRISFESN
ncbi:hypothetical protein B0H12DRAFT_1155287, partial [Mycena haematopus]